MNVSLTPELAKLVNDQVTSGRFGSASEVVRAALRLMQEREEKREWLVRELKKGFDQIERGEGIPFTPELLEQIKTEGRRKAGQRRKESA